MINKKAQNIETPNLEYCELTVVVCPFTFATTESLSPNLKILLIENELRSIPVYLLRHQSHSYSNQVRKIYEEIVAQLDLLKS